MSKLKKILLISILAMLTVAMNTTVFASTKDILKTVGEVEYSVEFEEWLELSDEEKMEVKTPITFEVLNTSFESKNQIDIVQSVGSTLESRYTLQDYIPENMVVRNQMQTGSCWAFASLGVLESNLALTNYYNDKEAKVYDLSERHMEYSASREFKNGAINKYGLDNFEIIVLSDNATSKGNSITRTKDGTIYAVIKYEAKWTMTASGKTFAIYQEKVSKEIDNVPRLLDDNLSGEMTYVFKGYVATDNINDTNIIDFEKERLSRKVYEEVSRDFERKINKTNKK